MHCSVAPDDESDPIEQRKEQTDRSMRMLLTQDRNQHLLVVPFGEERDRIPRGGPEDHVGDR